MENAVAASATEDKEEESPKAGDITQEEIHAVPTTVEPPAAMEPEAKRSVCDAQGKDDKTAQQALRSLDGMKTAEEKLSAMCKKYSELLHDNRQLQATVKQCEKNINTIHREKEQFRNERSKAVLAKTRMEQLCRELQKLNKAQQEETALKLRVEEEKRKEICLTYQSTFAEMNTLTNQNNEKYAKMREENLELRGKIKSVEDGIRLTEAQLDGVREQSAVQLELAEKKYRLATLEFMAEKEVLKEDKQKLLMKLGLYHVQLNDQKDSEKYNKIQIEILEGRLEELKRYCDSMGEAIKKKTRSDAGSQLKKAMVKWEKSTALWKQRWEKTNAAVDRMMEIKEKRDAEMATMNNKLSTLQGLCKVFQRERSALMAQLRDKNGGAGGDNDAEPFAKENRKSMKQFEQISNDCEKIKHSLGKLEGLHSKVVKQAIRSPVYFAEDGTWSDERAGEKVKSEARNESNREIRESEASLENDDTDVTEDDRNETESLESEEKENTLELSETEATIANLERHENILEEVD